MPAQIQWTSRFGFLMAAIGFAVGLGNIWRFPYVTGENGGGAFVLIYLACVLLIGVPIVMAELMIGRRGRKSPPGSIAAVAATEQRSAAWAMVGNLHLLTAFLILIVYAVVAGWVLAYFVSACLNDLTGTDQTLALGRFALLQGDTEAQLAWTLAVLLITAAVLFAGVQRGIERVVTVLMPLLFALLVGLATYNLFAGGFREAVDYLFRPDFTRVDGRVVLAAVGQAFFSIGVAMAGMMTFGAYLDHGVSIGRSALLIGLVDSLVAIIAGLVIFPFVFRFGLDPGAGTGLIFQTLPVAFAMMPAGTLIAALFFLLLTVAAVTSMIGLMEPLIAWTVHRLQLERAAGVMLVFVMVWMFSVVVVMGHSLWSDWSFMGRSLPDAIDFLANQIMLPLGGLLIAVFAGWMVRGQLARRELRLQRRWLFHLWRLLIRFLVPVAVAAIMLVGLA